MFTPLIIKDPADAVTIRIRVLGRISRERIGGVAHKTGIGARGGSPGSVAIAVSVCVTDVSPQQECVKCEQTICHKVIPEACN